MLTEEEEEGKARGAWRGAERERQGKVKQAEIKQKRNRTVTKS
jgi:hypothetical protein